MAFIIRRLELHDFLSHADTTIEFGEGLTAIVGVNGAGKSSIVDAIYYGLLIPLTRDEAVRGEKKNLVRKGSPTGKARLYVELEDPGTGERLEVHAIIAGERGKSEVTVYYTDSEGRRRRLASGARNRESREAIAHTLGVPPDTYKTVLSGAVILRQNALQNLISLFTREPAKRREFLRSIFGVESYKKAEEKLSRLSVGIGREQVSPVQTIGQNLQRRLGEEKAKIRRLESEIRKLEEKLAGLREELAREEASLEEARAKIEGLRESVRGLEGERSALKARLSEINKRLATMLDAKNKYERMGCARAEEELESLEAKRGEVEPLIGELREILEELEPLQKRLESLSLELEKLKNRIEKLEELAEILEGRSLRTLEEALGEAKKRLGEARERLSEVEARIKNLERILDSYKKGLERASRLLEKIGLAVSPASLGDLEETAADLESRIRRLEDEILAWESKSRTLREKARENREKARILEEGGGGGKCPLCGHALTREEAETIAGNLKREAERAEEEARRLEEESSRARRRVSTLKSTLGNLQGIIGFLRQLEGDLASVGGVEGAERLLEELGRERRELLRIIAGLEGEIDSLSSNIAHARILLRDLGLDPDTPVTRREVSRAREELARLEEEKRRLGERRLEYEERLQSLLESIASKLGARADPTAVIREYERLSKRILELQHRLVECAGLREAFSGLDELKREKTLLTGRLESVESELASKLEELAGLEERLRGLEERVRRLHGEASRAEGEKKRIESMLGESRDMVSQLEEALQAYRILEYVRRIFKEAPEEIYRRKLFLLERIASRVISGFGLKYVGVMARDDGRGGFTFALQSREGISVDVEALSGGEQSVFALALVVALNKLLGGRIGFLVLDEPTAHLDKERRSLIAEVLRSLVSGDEALVRQVIVVTHEEEVVDAADEVYRVSYEAGRSRVASETRLEAVQTM